MTRRTTGTVFVGIAAFLFSIRYIAAALYGSGINLNNEFSREAFQSFLSYVGNLPLTLSIIYLVIGIIYLMWAELEDRKK
jgi:hypothetical protein